MGKTYSTVNITGAGTVAVTGANTYTNFTRTGTALKTDGVTFAATNTVTGTLTLGGNSTQGVNRLQVSSSVVGTQRTINCTGAAVVISGDVCFQDIDITGSPSWSNAGSAYVGDALGNGTLITTNRTTPATQTATGTASFTWSTHGWTSRVPLPQDNVSIPNAFVAGRTVTADMPCLGADISFAGCTGSPTWSVSVVASMFGSLTLATGVAPSATNTLSLSGRSSHTITSAGATFTQGITIAAPSGTYTLSDAFTDSRNSSAALFVTMGTFVDAGFSVSLTSTLASGFTISGGTLTKTGAWSFAGTNTATFWTASGGTVTDSGSITLSAASANTRTFAGGGKTYGALIYTVSASSGALVITGANTFATLTVTNNTTAKTLTLPSSTTTTITSALNLSGGTAKVILGASTPGTFHTLSAGGGVTVTSDSASISDSHASGGASFRTTHSTDAGGNTGWTFAGGGGLALLGVG